MFSLIKAYWLPLTLMVLFSITTLSLWPAEQLPRVVGGDKIHHYIAYALLTLPVAIKKPKYWQFILLSFLFYSGVIELIQGYFNRYGEWLDLVANSLGILTGVIVAQLISYSIRTFINKNSNDYN
jgi:VanZ family protein